MHIFEKASNAKKDAEFIRKSAKEEIDHVKSTSLSKADRPRDFGIMEERDTIVVYMESYSINGIGKVRITIKRFYTNYDEEFARLKAQELLNHLNER